MSEANRRAFEVDGAKALRSQANDLVVVDGVERRGLVEDRRNVTGEIGLARRGANHERRDSPCGNDHVRFGGVHHGEREGAAHDQEALTNGLHELESLGAELFNQVRQDFGVGDRREDMAPRLETLFQFRVVLDDAVMDDRDVARAVEVRVGIHGLGGSVRGPTGVADPGRETLGGGEALLFQGRHRFGAGRGSRPPGLARAHQCDPR